MDAEYGPKGAFGFPKSRMFDDEGEEMEIKRCPTCNASMMMVRGKESYIWYCYEHGFSSNVSNNEDGTKRS